MNENTKYNSSMLNTKPSTEEVDEHLSCFADQYFLYHFKLAPVCDSFTHIMFSFRDLFIVFSIIISY